MFQTETSFLENGLSEKQLNFKVSNFYALLLHFTAASREYLSSSDLQESEKVFR